MSDKRISDTIDTLLTGLLSIDLLAEQSPLSLVDLKTITQRLLSSTTIKLSSGTSGTSSIDKLFDLVIMASKSHFFRCCCPEELFQVVLNHLDQCIGFCTRSTQINGIKTFITLAKEKLNKLSPYRWTQLRAAVLNVFIGLKIKIAVLLKEGLQDELTGDLVTDCVGLGIPGAADSPGTVTRGAVKEKYAVHGSWSVRCDQVSFDSISSNLGLSLFPQPAVKVGNILPRHVPQRKSPRAEEAERGKEESAKSNGLDYLANSFHRASDQGAQQPHVCFEAEDIQSFTEAEIQRVNFDDLFAKVRKSPTIVNSITQAEISGDDLLNMMDDLDPN